MTTAENWTLLAIAGMVFALLMSMVSCGRYRIQRHYDTQVQLSTDTVKHSPGL